MESASLRARLAYRKRGATTAVARLGEQFGVRWVVTFSGARARGDLPSMLVSTGFSSASGVANCASAGTLTGTGATVKVVEDDLDMFS